MLYTATVAAKASQSTPNQAPRYYGVFVFNLDKRTIINIYAKYKNPDSDSSSMATLIPVVYCSILSGS